MNTMHLALANKRVSLETETNQRRRNWMRVLYLCGGVGPAMSLFGLLLSAAAFFKLVENAAQVNRTGTWLMVAAFPIVMLGAHALDKIGEIDEQAEKKTPRGGRKKQNLRAAAMEIMMIKIYAVLILMMIGFAARTNAQQTIFNVPSTDILDRGKIYAEFDATFKTNDSDAVRRFSAFVPRVVIGTGKNAEVGLNITGNIQPGADSTTLVPNAKWRVYNGEKNGVAVVVGDNLFVPVRNKSYHIGNYAYAQISKTLAKTKTRITGGAYHYTKNTVAANAGRAGGQFAFEQTVNKRLSINADWITGKHSAGYFTPGIAFKPSPKVTGYAGYSIGNANARRGNDFFLFELGYNFN